jgi:hypothetical protein
MYSTVLVAAAGVALAVQGKMTTKISEQGKPIPYNVSHVEVSDDLLHGIFFKFNVAGRASEYHSYGYK